MCGLADPGTVAVSETIERVVRDTFELERMLATTVKGVDDPIVLYRAVGERDTPTTAGRAAGRPRTELEYLQRSWAQAMEGTLPRRGCASRARGYRQDPAGVRRSRHGSAGRAAVIGMFGSPFYADVGLRPVRRLLERRCGIKRDSDPAERLRKLQAEVTLRSLDPAAMVPLLAPVLGISSESGYQPARAEGPKLYGQIAGAIHDYLLACLGSGPALVFIDDVHWFDEDTVEVVQALLRERVAD